MSHKMNQWVFYKQLILVHDYEITLIQNDGLMQTFKLFHYFSICYMSIWTIFTIWILYVVVHTRRYTWMWTLTSWPILCELQIYTDHNTDTVRSYTKHWHRNGYGTFVGFIFRYDSLFKFGIIIILYQILVHSRELIPLFEFYTFTQSKIDTVLK